MIKYGPQKFTPQPGFQGMASFQLQAATSSTEVGLGGQVVVAQIQVQPQLLSCQLSINQGLNLVGLPLQPESDWHLPQLLAVLPADFLFYYDGAGFQFYNGGSTQQVVKAGSGYVAVRDADQAADYVYRGTGWQSSLSVAPAIWSSHN